MIFILLIAAGGLLNNKAIETAQAFTSGLNNGFTGAPNEVTCATSGCHSSLLQTDKEDFTITATPPSTDNNLYDITVKSISSDPNRNRWGFQVTALTSGNQPAGRFIDALDGTTELLPDKGPNNDRQYIQNSAAGTFRGDSQATWKFQWQATTSDEVIFYAAGVQADNNRTSTGDFVFSATATIRPSVPAVDPKITEATVKGKKLLVRGEDFANGAMIFMNEEKQKTQNDAASPRTSLIAKKAGRNIAPGQTVAIKVKNPDGRESNEIMFTRPADN